MAVSRTFVILLAGAALFSGCDSRPDEGAAGPTGILIFGGLPSGSYLHAVHPDGSGLREVRLPATCSPKALTRDGRIVWCDQWTEPWHTYVAENHDGGWRRTRLPREWRFPRWIVKKMQFEQDFAIDAPQWSPAHDRLAFVRRPHAPAGDIWWYSGTGDVVVAAPHGDRERVVASDGEVPAWSPDGTRLAFARCRVTKADYTDEDAEDTARCSVWTVSVYAPVPPHRLADDADSPPVWSPDGRYVAFFRAPTACVAICRGRIVIVPSDGGEPQRVGPELAERSQLLWLRDSSAALTRSGETIAGGPLELQRCVDIWNRARMRWADRPANVRRVNGRCEVTVAAYRDAGVLAVGFACTQPVPFSYECPSHGDRLQAMNPAQRVWNARSDGNGTLALVSPPTGHRLPLPKAPPYPILEGYIVPFARSGQLRAGLRITKKVRGTCTSDGYVNHPDSVRCGWPEGGFDYLNNQCWKDPGPLRVTSVALCPEGAGSTRFVRVKLSKRRPTS